MEEEEQWSEAVESNDENEIIEDERLIDDEAGNAEVIDDAQLQNNVPAGPSLMTRSRRPKKKVDYKNKSSYFSLKFVYSNSIIYNVLIFVVFSVLGFKIKLGGM